MSKRRKYQDVSDLGLPDAAVPENSSMRRGSEGDGANAKSGANAGPGLDLGRAALLPLRILGSLTFGLIIIAALIVLFAWGTFIESHYGASVAKFVLYGNRWFAVLLAVFAVNLASAMVLRFPWKFHHLPFLLAHGGIVVLIFGCWITWQRGQEAQISLPEGAAGKFATRMEKQHFTVNTVSHFASVTPEAHNIPFEPGPFNWEDYDREKWRNVPNRRFRNTLGFAMRWGHRDRGNLVKSSQDMQIKVLDYCASSTAERVPPLELNVLWKKTLKTKTELGDVKETPRNWERVRLDSRTMDHFRGMEIRGTQVEMLGGERINYAFAPSMAEIEAFQSSKPDWSDNFGAFGQLVLHYQGRNHYIDVDRLIRETEGGKRFTLPDTPLQIGDVNLRERGPIIALALFTSDGTRNVMTLFPDNPEMNVQAEVFGVFGTFWVSPEKLMQSRPEYQSNPMVRKLTQPRIDLVQGPDRKIYYRYWTGTTVASLGVVPDREPGTKSTFSVAAGTPDEAEIVIERFAPQDLPGYRIVPQPVGRQRGTEQRARLEVTVDGKTDTFWLRAVYPTVVPLPPERDQVRYVYGNGRTVRIQWEFDTIDLGFGVFLKKFEMRTEPGTRMSSHYSSLVDFVDMGAATGTGFSRSPDEFRPYDDGKDVLISMNQPAVFQGTGKSYRIYQASYTGPYHPGDFRFHELYDGKIFPWETKPRETLYMSTLSVNDDPGRGLKYLGCFLLVFGTAWFIYRKKTA